MTLIDPKRTFHRSLSSYALTPTLQNVLGEIHVLYHLNINTKK